MNRQRENDNRSGSGLIVHFFLPFLLVILLTLLSPVAIAQDNEQIQEDEIIDSQSDQDIQTDQPSPEVRVVPLRPPLNVTAEDKPNDSGNRITIEWKASPDEVLDRLKGYDVYRSETDDPDDFVKINAKILGLKTTSYEDRRENKIGGHVLKNNTPYYYKIVAVGNDDEEASSSVTMAKASATIFNKRKVNTLIIVFIYIGILIYSIGAAKSGRSTYIRRLAGIDAIEEAVGRATEMGKPVMYLCGLSDLSDVSTIAAINILGGVARKVANYQSRLLLPCRDPMVMTVAQEVVKEAYLAEGRPDAYKEDDIYYTTYDQFPYVASVDGIMLREKPATNLYMGYYYAESLILAETGSATGAIQIAGTDAVTQLPFFVTACDYTLLGEELYAASAYISKNPLLIGSLKGQDYMKFVLGLCIVLGILLATYNTLYPSTWIQSVIDFIKPLTSG